MNEGFFSRHSRPWLYVPNLIGYARVLFAVIGFGVARKHPIAFMGLYFVSFVCDELDGRFARMFNQSTIFGSVLDMVTDRLATACLLALVGSMYPKLFNVTLALVVLDIFSHWFQMYAAARTGAVTHKKSRNWIVNLYYQYRFFMGFCCVSCEVLYLAIYSLHPSFGFVGAHGRMPYFLPMWIIAPVLEWLHGLGIDLPMSGMPIGAVIVLIALPGFAIKQVTNVEQLRDSAVLLLSLDAPVEGSVKRAPKLA